MKKTFSVISLGCFRNLYDSEIVTKRFIDNGYEYLDLKTKDNLCDTLLINTCGFITDAKKESIQVIKEALELKRKGRIKKIFVFGCLVKRYKKYLEKFMPDVDVWWDTEPFSKKFVERKKLTPEFIDFLKITEGCFNNCSYCVIPQIKGSLKSKLPEEIIKEVKFLDSKGIKELNIIGQDITSWGKDLGKGFDLSKLLRKIVKATKKISWVRLLYTHPAHFTDELIEVIADEEKICKYIDLPIQHISDRILKLMNRNTTSLQIRKLIEKIRKKIKDVVLRTTVIVGFPTETEKDFKKLCRFLEEIKFERLGAFMYSREENTKAYYLKPQVHHSIKKSRYSILMNLQKDIASQINKRFIGKSLEVLVEEKENDYYVARSQYDAYQVDGVVFVKRKNLAIGKFYRVNIKDAYEYDLVAE